MVHPFFDELRGEGARMPNQKEFPPLFNFTREGKYVAGTEGYVTDDRMCRALRTA